MIHKFQSQSKSWIPFLGFGFYKDNNTSSYHGILQEGFFIIFFFHFILEYFFITDSLHSAHSGNHCRIKYKNGLTMEKQNNTIKNKTNNIKQNNKKTNKISLYYKKYIKIIPQNIKYHKILTNLYYTRTNTPTYHHSILFKLVLFFIYFFKIFISYSLSFHIIHSILYFINKIRT